MKENIILSRTFDFALQIIELYRALTKNHEFILSKQILRAGTSIGGNVEEAIAAQSRRDFISKMTIACKEARETRYFLRLLKQSQLVPLNYETYLEENESIINILTSIVKTSQQKM